MESRRILTVVALGAAFALAGCAEPPQAEIDAVATALGGARDAEAAQYAPEALRAAEDAQAELQAELKLQEERFALTRSYDKAKELAQKASGAAAEAERTAAQERERAREAATQLIAEVRTTVAEVKDMLEKAPRGKGTEADLAMLKSDVGSIESSLADMDNAFAEERYLEAKTKAEAAQESAARVREEITRAIETASQRSRRRG